MLRFSLLTVPLFSVALSVTSAEAATIRFASEPSFSGASLTVADVTITGSGTVINTLGVGLGIDDTGLGNGESMLFSFAAPVINVTYGTSEVVCPGCAIGPSVGDRTLEIFGVLGTSLGIFNQTFFDQSVSSLVSNAPIGAFRLTMAPGHFITPDLLRYDLAPPIPLPATLPLALSGLVLLGVLGCRRSRRT